MACTPMADALKDHINAAAVGAVIARFKDAAADVGVAFDVDVATRQSRGFHTLELKARGHHVAGALAAAFGIEDNDEDVADVDAADHDDVLHAVAVALAQPLSVNAMVYFVHDALLQRLQRRASFDVAMAANVALTERFTAEFSIRPLLERDPEQAIAWLQALSTSDNEHHRRLVSEGTRPRLPWAQRLETFQRLHGPVDELLLQLSRDPSLYVRRSVANHLGDIAKTELDRALELCAAIDDDDTGRWVKRHALRHPVKQGDARALAALGFDAADADHVVVRGAVAPAVVVRGGVVNIDVVVENAHSGDVDVVIDVVVDYVKADGGTSAKTFKLKTATLGGGERVALHKTLGTHDLSTRVHHAGRHQVWVQVNGQTTSLGAFDLR